MLPMALWMKTETSSPKRKCNPLQVDSRSPLGYNWICHFVTLGPGNPGWPCRILKLGDNMLSPFSSSRSIKLSIVQIISAFVISWWGSLCVLSQNFLLMILQCMYTLLLLIWNTLVEVNQALIALSFRQLTFKNWNIIIKWDWSSFIHTKYVRTYFGIELGHDTGCCYKDDNHFSCYVAECWQKD